MGRNHVRVLMDLPQVKVVGLADPNTEVAGHTARKYNLPLYADCVELLDTEQPDAIVLAVPTVDHHQSAMAAIERGIHLLVEKPIAETVDQATEMVEAAEKKGVALTVGHIERFNPAVIELKRRMDAGELGRVFMVHARRQSPFPARIRDVGVASDLATHELDMMRYLTGSEVVNLHAEISQVLHPSHEDIVFGLLRFGSDVLGILDVNWVTPTKIRECNVIGERGMFVVNYLNQELRFHRNSSASGTLNGQQFIMGHDWSVDEGDMIQLRIDRREPLRNELEAFIRMITAGAAPVVSGKDGIQALDLATRIVEDGRSARVAC